MARATNAGALYALIVFAVGFVLGTIRVLLVAPHLGETAAVFLETPFMLVARWFVCRRCVDRLDVPRRNWPRSCMGLVGFVVLMGPEFALGSLTFGRSGAEQLAAYGSAPGGIGLAAQVVFATFPVVQIWRP
jgi:hypothetical protein